MPQLQLVRIIKGDPETQQLLLSCNGRRDAHHSDEIQWVIQGNSGVYSITQILPKTDWDDLWQTLPEPLGGLSKNWRGKVGNGAPTDKDFGYLIEWKATKSGQPLTHDPIITIRPSSVILDTASVPFVIKTINWILSSILFITGISFFMLWLKKRKDN